MYGWSGVRLWALHQPKTPDNPANLRLIHLSVTISRRYRNGALLGHRGTRGMTGSLIAECVLRIATALALLGFSGCASDVAPPPSAEPSFYRNLAKGGELDADAAQSMISGYRANNGLGAVVIDPQLTRLAEEQSRAMATRDKLDHNVGKPFEQRIRGHGYDAKVAVENVSAGYHTLAEAFSGWRDSPPHRANMLHKGVTRMGIAAVYSSKSKYKVFWTLILATPDDKRG
jgi:uncharacterized protein YkwD